MDYWKENYTSVTQLMANCLLEAEDIRHAMLQFEQHKRNFQISCFKYGWMNPWWAVKLDTKQHPERLFPETSSQRSQDLPDLYCPTGAIWIARTEEFLAAQTFYGTKHVFEPLSWKSAADIDDYDDLLFAEVLHQQMLTKI